MEKLECNTPPGNPPSATKADLYAAFALGSEPKRPEHEEALRRAEELAALYGIASAVTKEQMQRK